MAFSKNVKMCGSIYKIEPALVFRKTIGIVPGLSVINIQSLAQTAARIAPGRATIINLKSFSRY
jgi:hypothetical protein